ncbi:hypothetical protein BKA83DRAFT_4125960 [Pisolithus microcarpus]|nr:hypothetical protein BKA83DRAFT_4125960 [Pisolithus microcarpus]
MGVIARAVMPNIMSHCCKFRGCRPCRLPLKHIYVTTAASFVAAIDCVDCTISENELEFDVSTPVEPLPLTTWALPMSHYTLLRVSRYTLHNIPSEFDVSTNYFEFDVSTLLRAPSFDYVSLAHVTWYLASGGCSCMLLDGDPSFTLYLASTLLVWGCWSGGTWSMPAV